MTLLELLVKVQIKLGDPRRHCKRLPSQNINGHYVHPRSESASSWSLLGAVGAESGDNLDVHRQAVWLIADLVRSHGGQSVSRWEDHPDTSYGDVMELIEEAIQFASK